MGTTGGPAFPCLEAVVTGIDSDGVERFDTEAHGGMTLRDYFATKSMMGICAHNDSWGCPSVADIAETAYRMADAMLAERLK